MYRKADFPVGKIRRYVEPGPIVMVSSAWKGKQNIMTMGWHTVMQFKPYRLSVVTSSRATTVSKCSGAARNA